jgi:hypothetical protein
MGDLEHSPMTLVEVDECIYDERLLSLAHGFESLDPVGREAFINHVHIDGGDRLLIAERLIESWAGELRSRWPACEFRIYRHVRSEEVTIRFHRVRPGFPNWCEEGIEVMSVGPVS